MISNWDPEKIQAQLRLHETRKQAAADRCRSQIRFGKEDYKRFYDEETAEQRIAGFLSTNGALESRDRTLELLAEVREYVADGSLDAVGIYSKKHFRRQAMAYIDHLESRIKDSSKVPDLSRF